MKIFSDIFAMVTFSIAFGVPIDIFAGMTTIGIFYNRLMSIPINISLGRFQGIFIDFTRSKVQNRFIADTFALTLFQTFVYACILQVSSIISGEQTGLENILRGSLVIFIYSFFIGRIYGIWLDKVRMFFSGTSVSV